MVEELKIIREEIEVTLEKSERYENLLLLFAQMKNLSLFSINKKLYVVHDESIYRMDSLFSEECTLQCKDVKHYLKRYLDEDFEVFTTSQFLGFCYRELGL
ncbi:hypothetical protein KI659_17115 [Litoribacter alkaliphilus]|uniref:Uncharacterized protein n=1 Tax=Litoribacter ruber TaxID=702568 RepID=A0AAP2G6J1_9BACT|nr:hypothetical protein [Litoribacter alkaliphilus]MBS9525743.1 hypothetical protein [Litoribacter alkaliphilus]